MSEMIENDIKLIKKLKLKKINFIVSSKDRFH